MSGHIATLDEWHKHKAYLEFENPDFFKRNRLRAMSKLTEQGYVFGYEIAGYGTTVGCTHKHITKERAEACGRRFLAGIPTWHIWRKRKSND